MTDNSGEPNRAPMLKESEATVTSPYGYGTIVCNVCGTQSTFVWEHKDGQGSMTLSYAACEHIIESCNPDAAIYIKERDNSIRLLRTATT